MRVRAYIYIHTHIYVYKIWRAIAESDSANVSTTGRKKERERKEIPNEIKFNIHTAHVEIKILIPMKIIYEKEREQREEGMTRSEIFKRRETGRPTAIS